jgi:hypothetical protein
MKHLVTVLALGVLGVALAAPDGAPNTLTAQEKAQGWKLLFDGKTIDGWVVNGNAKWMAVDGAVTAEGRGGWLATKDDYTNFQLRLEFRTNAPNINSGVFLRRGRVAGDSHNLGYELQIRNPGPNDRPYDGKPDNHNGYYTGSFSGHLKSKTEPTVEMGKWHALDVTANGDHFVVVIDGKKVLDDRHGQFKSGAIGLQNTGQKIEFRSIRVRPL